MARSEITNLAMGKFLQIVFSDGVRNQISESYRDWEMIERLRKGPGVEREHRFLFQTSFGPAGVQYANPGSSGRSFPTAQDIDVDEYTAVMNEIHSTVEIEYNMWKRAMLAPKKYAEPLAIKIKSSATAAKRRLAADLYGEGSGVLGEVADVSASVDFATSGTAVQISLDADDSARGAVGMFEYGDKVQFYDLDGTEHALADGGTSASYGLVTAKDRANDKITVAWYDSSDNLLTIDGLGTVTDTDVLIRQPQPSKVDLSTTVTDYNTATEVFAGLESLAAYDGRTVHGITMSGAAAGSHYDCGAASIDSSHLQAALSEVKTAVGPGVYKYPGMVMAPETNNSLVESREVDRRFTSIADNKRGVNKFVYVHEDDNVEVITSEFCPKKRIWILPQEKTGQNVLEFHGTDFEPVKPNGEGSEFFLKPSSSGGHVGVISSYMLAMICLICKHPKAIQRIHNFS
jgi:hypothetical protein